MNLTSEQQQVLYKTVKDIKEHNKKEVRIGGFAGTGKTTIVRYLCGFFPGFGVSAYTGKASNVLRKKGIEDASTIHSRIYVPFIVDGVLIDFELAPKSQLACNGFIIDEASMVTGEIYSDLAYYGYPIIYIGDHGQLEPVNSDFNLMANPTYRLETIHRNANDIARFAEVLRKGKEFYQFKGKEGRIDFLKQKLVSDDDLMSVNQVICAYNQTRVSLNKRMRSILGYPEDKIVVGERLICLQNNKEHGVFNGMQGIVRKIHQSKTGKPLIDFEFDGQTHKNIPYDKKSLNNEKPKIGFDGPIPFDYSYAITCHKCVHPETLVETNEGLSAIKDICKEGKISTPNGVQDYKNLIKYPSSECVEIRTKYGYNLCVTLNHKVEIWDNNNFKIIQAHQISEGNLMRVYLGNQINPVSDVALNLEVETHCLAEKYDTPCIMTEEFSEFLGLMVADGTLWKTGFRLAKRHNDVVLRFGKLCNNLFGVKVNYKQIENTPCCEVHSSYLSKWLLSLGGLHPHKKDVPECIMKCNLTLQSRFLKGLFADGWVDLKNGKFDHIGWSNVNPILVNKVRIMLLRLGIVSSELSTKPDSNLYIYGRYANLYAQKIGFIASFKNDRLPKSLLHNKYDCIPISQEELKDNRQLFIKDDFLTLFDYQNGWKRGKIHREKAARLAAINKDLKEIISDRMKYFYVNVSSLEKKFSESMCVEVPVGNRFFQNGFPFSNSQGDEFESGLVYEQKCKNWEHRRWAYTAASRFKEYLKWAY